MRRNVPPDILAAIIAGALSGVAGALLFAALHALIIVPIWDRMINGLIFGALAGGAAGWAFAECHPEAVRTGGIRSVTAGARFGALLWFAVTPVTGADTLLRALRFAPRYDLLSVAIAVILAAAGGATLAWLVARRTRAAIAGSVAGVLLVIAMAGPVPVGRSARALNIFLAVFPAAVLGGIALGLFSAPIFDRITTIRRGPHAPAD